MERDEQSANEFGSSTGDMRENDPSLPGFTDESERLFRSQFQHAYRFGYQASADERFVGKQFDEVEKDLEGDWLNVRLTGDEWQSVRSYAREGFERGKRIGFADGLGAGTDSHHRPSFADPVAGNIDPTAPDSPEQTGGA
jgi:hypothetical protein